MKSITVILTAAIFGLAVAAPTEDGMAVVDQILAVIDGKADLTRIGSYLKEYHDEFLINLPTFDSDGKTKAVYTFFFPTTKSFIRQTPQDVADPLALDFDFRRTVFARHFARQLISFDDLNKLDTILMADSKEATVTRDAGVLKINDAVILKDVVFESPSGLVIIYVVDKVFMGADELTDVLKKNAEKGVSSTADEPDGIRNTPLAPPNPILGGFVTVGTADKDVQAIALFAVTAIAQSVNAETPPSLGLVSIVKAEKQVVAGINYRLAMVLKSPQNDAINCEVMVLDQSWLPNRELANFKCDPSLTR